MDTIEPILGLCKTILDLVEKTKTNKERCQRLAQRVKDLEELVLTIKQRRPGQMSDTVTNALKQLCITLESARELMRKYSQTTRFKSFLKSMSHEDKFCKVNERLTDTFQLLSGALQIEHGNILYELYDNVSGRRWGEEYCSGPTDPVPAPCMLPSAPPCSPIPSTPVTCMTPSASVCSPVSPTPVTCMIPSASVCSPITPTPVTCMIPSASLCSPVTPMPVCCFMTSRPLCSPVTPMPVLRIISPVRVGAVAPICLPVNVATMSVTRSITSMPFSLQNNPR
eukprot:superscaffoldBa00015578_g26648